MNFDDVLIGMWVVVQYEDEKFIGIVHIENGLEICLVKSVNVEVTSRTD